MEKLTDFVKWSGFSYDNSILDELKREKLPLLIYGFGNCGQHLLEYLTDVNIKISAIFVDAPFYKEVHCDTITLYKTEEIDSYFKEYNVIAGMTDYNYVEQSLHKLKGCIRTFYLCNPYQYLDDKMITWEYFCQKQREFQESFECFEDELSRKIFIAYLNSVINRDYRYLLDYEGCKTYFNKELVNCTENESFVDAGAYNGDTLLKFLDAVKHQYNAVYAIEPDKRNFAELLNLVEQNGWERIELINNGVWKQRDVLRFKTNRQQESSILADDESSKYEEVTVDSLNHMLRNREVSFIKLSVQGAEEEALQGANEILERQHPKLALTIFMKKDSLFVLPQMLKEKYPFYKLYLRCEEPFWIRTILYAIPS